MTYTMNPIPPEFQTRNPAEAAFWQERWQSAHTPWDKGGVQAAFETYVSSFSAPVPVLIPGCGSAHEAAYLAQRGWPVTALDYAESAVQAARAQLGEHADKAICADFFTYQPAQAPQWVFERTFLCALPVRLRDAYAEKMAALIPSGGVLAGLFYIDDQLALPEAQVKGPPFPMTQARLDALLTPHFVCEVNQASEDGLPLFVGKERWQVWRRK